MSYTPINWQTGQTITAEKLNKMDNGWSVESSQILSETVTTVDDGGTNYGSLAYASLIDAPLITVTFDGTDYTCSYTDQGYGAQWSDTLQGYDFSTYPFNIYSWTDPGGTVGNDLVTETAGSHTIVISVDSVETSDPFRSAVNSVAGKDYTVSTEMDLIWEEYVTTEGTPAMTTLGYTGEITAEEINVQFDGNSYTCPNNNGTYGAPFDGSSFDWSEYPFHIGYDGGNIFITETAGTYYLQINAPTETVQGNTTFQKAVYSIAPPTEAIIPSMSIVYVQFYNTSSVTIAAHSSASVSFVTSTYPSEWANCERYMIANVSGGTRIGDINLVNWSISGYTMTATVQNLSDSSLTIGSTSLHVDAYGFLADSSSAINYLSGSEAK